jgi:hypothetical protein
MGHFKEGQIGCSSGTKQTWITQENIGKNEKYSKK